MWEITRDRISQRSSSPGRRPRRPGPDVAERKALEGPTSGLFQFGIHPFVLYHFALRLAGGLSLHFMRDYLGRLQGLTQGTRNMSTNTTEERRPCRPPPRPPPPIRRPIAGRHLRDRHLRPGRPGLPRLRPPRRRGGRPVGPLPGPARDLRRLGAGTSASSATCRPSRPPAAAGGGPARAAAAGAPEHA